MDTLLDDDWATVIHVELFTETWILLLDPSTVRETEIGLPVVFWYEVL